MKYLLMSAALTGLIAAGTCAVAQDQTQQSSQAMQSDNDGNNSGNKAETMKQCMARQRATNSGLTNEAMKTTCRNEMKTNSFTRRATTYPRGRRQAPSHRRRISRRTIRRELCCAG